MTVAWQLAAWGVTMLVAVGVTYGDARARLARMEKMMGNGGDGVFARRKELEMLVKRADEEHKEIYRRLDKLERRR